MATRVIVTETTAMMNALREVSGYSNSLQTACTYKCTVGVIARYDHIRKLEEHSIEVHNSRQPPNHLTLTLTLTLTFDNFDLIFIGGRGIVMDMDYPCAYLAIFVSAVLVLSCGHIQTESHTEADQRYTLTRLTSA